jgi:GT2 family glycosyltransferase
MPMSERNCARGWGEASEQGAPGDRRCCVVIPNWNGRTHLEYSVQSLGCTREAHGCTVLVDDGSRDGSSEYVAESFPWVTVLRRKVNGGFAAAVNTGVRWALDNQYRYVAVFNSDIRVPAGFLAPVLDFMDQYKDVAIAGYTAVYGPSDSQLSVPNHVLFQDVAERLPGMLYVCRVGVLAAAGLFDEQYFMYGEESDLYRRIIRGGFHIVQSNIPVWHHVGGSCPRASTRIAWLSYRNRVRCALKTGSLRQVGVEVIASLYHALFRNPLPARELFYSLCTSSASYESQPVDKLLTYRQLHKRYDLGSVALNLVVCLCALLWNVFFLPRTLRERLADNRRLVNLRQDPQGW